MAKTTKAQYDIRPVTPLGDNVTVVIEANTGSLGVRRGKAKPAALTFDRWCEMTKGQRRAVRRKLYRSGFRNVAHATVAK